jgi:hypothetical protein
VSSGPQHDPGPSDDPGRAPSARDHASPTSGDNSVDGPLSGRGRIGPQRWTTGVHLGDRLGSRASVHRTAETSHHRSLVPLHNPPHRWSCGNRLHPHCAQALVLLLLFSSRGTTQEPATWMDRSSGRNRVAPGRGDTRCPEALRWSSGTGRSGRTQRGARRRNRHDPRLSRRSVHRARPPHRQRERSPP